jgi:hypothetical protein
MDSKVIAVQMLENINKGEVGLGEIVVATRKYIEDNVRVNAELVLAMAGEAQFFDVAGEILTAQWPNDTLEKLIKLPGLLELVDGPIINQYREPVQVYALSLVDKLLDKVFGPDWFEHIQSVAKNVSAGK